MNVRFFTDQCVPMEVARRLRTAGYEVIVLRDFEELTVKEIASRLHTLPETVKTRIHRGRQMIREHLLA